MSIIPLAGLFSMALQFYNLTINVSDVSYTKVDGEDIPTITAIRTIQAAIEPSNGKNMQYLFGGSVSDGDIGVFTNGTLYINDVEDRGPQSYVEYEGLIYRTANSQEWKQQTGMTVYLCKRHVKQGGVI